MENNKCRCVKEEEISKIKDKLHETELRDVKQEKDMEMFQNSIDRLNETLDDFKAILEQLTNEPVERYKKIWSYTIGGAIGAIVAFLMGIILS